MAYLKEAFEPTSLEHAKTIALTSDPAWPQKFKEETEYLVNVIQLQKIITTQSLVLDFGCGMGRVSKRLIKVLGCRTIGTDTSERVLGFATQYVAHPLFEAMQTYATPGSVDVTIASFVLQHAEDPQKEIESIYAILKEGGHLVLLDDGKRFVPSGTDTHGYVVWQDDGIVVEGIVQRYFTCLARFPYPNRIDFPLSIWRKK